VKHPPNESGPPAGAALDIATTANVARIIPPGHDDLWSRGDWRPDGESRRAGRELDELLHSDAGIVAILAEDYYGNSVRVSMDELRRALGCGGCGR
jgi:hypothetical protein